MSEIHIKLFIPIFPVTISDLLGVEPLLEDMSHNLNANVPAA